MPKPNPQWTQPYLGYSYFTTYDYHVMMETRHGRTHVQIFKQKSDSSGKYRIIGFTSDPIAVQDFSGDNQVNRAKTWAEEQIGVKVNT
jgi:hypothetical protein